MPQSVVVYGGGSFGTAIAMLAAGNAPRTTLVCRTRAQADALVEARENTHYLPGVPLPDSLQVTYADDAAAVIADADVVVSALPSRVVAEMAPVLAAAMRPGSGLLSLTKGLDPGSGRLLSQVWVDALGDRHPYCMLSGPNHAREVAQGQPSASVVAGDPRLCAGLQALLTGERFRLYTNDDLHGVEICAAAKNVVAIAAGMSDGAGFGDNTKASLVTRGLAEMTRLGMAEGARASTFQGLAGMGDLVATCTSAHSRNRRAGELIAGGLKPAQVEDALGQVAEGLWTVPRLLQRARHQGVELPICAEVDAAVNGKPVTQCLSALMGRAPSAEG